ncbi:flavin reductase family protein [Pseudomonas sp. CK-NBRI-02]|uniref:flavin reductase family protein n=1 Tax=Pseudomonas TaxID=286 RepID=UPI00039E9665|nr:MULTISPECIES: flavin reductase family protein [Pseudomonas]MBH3359637.1 flavin reductase family protein [Pseudomonas guariconensis]TYO84104.1 flavin reductase family protein [Pseudomonas sp. CK-NBRI-02]
MTALRKSDFPLIDVRQHLETGPIVLVTSAWNGETNIMTMGWHMMMQFDPALFGCYIWSGNHSYELIRNSQQCVINVPTLELADQVVAVGNSTGSDVEKFGQFGLTATPATRVEAPLIAECYASFECQLYDSKLIGEYGLFVWEVVKAHVDRSVKQPKTLHYRGRGQFMVAGETLDFHRRFRPQNL